MNHILILNTGSSSIKFKIFGVDDKNLILVKEGKIDQICTSQGPTNHKAALSILFEGFEFGPKMLGNIPNLIAIGHRIVHGGDKFNKVTLLNNKTLKQLEKYNDLAPLHNPPVLEVIRAIMDVNGKKGHRKIPNYAVFDTAFYKDLPEIAKIYPIPYELYSERKIRKYGFHGISHQYAYESFVKENPQLANIITIHLGSGSSITAIKNGKPIDTSMGFTPLEGLMMGTRSGDIDPGVISYLINQKIITPKDLNKFLNNECGLYGIAGQRSEIRDLLYLAGYPVVDKNYVFKPMHNAELSAENRMRAKLAIEMYIYRIKKYIGAYAAILGRIDGVIFTGAVGYGSGYIRKRVIDGLEIFLNNAKIEYVKTNEELQIAREIIKNF